MTQLHIASLNGDNAHAVAAILQAMSPADLQTAKQFLNSPAAEPSPAQATTPAPAATAEPVGLDQLLALMRDLQAQQQALAERQRQLDADIQRARVQALQRLRDRHAAEYAELGFTAEEVWAVEVQTEVQKVLAADRAKPAAASTSTVGVRKRLATGKSTGVKAAQKNDDEPRVYDYLALEGSDARRPGFVWATKRPSDWHTGDHKTVNERLYRKATTTEMEAQMRKKAEWSAVMQGRASADTHRTAVTPMLDGDK